MFYHNVTLIIDHNKGLKFNAFLFAAILQERQYIVISVQSKQWGHKTKQEMDHYYKSLHAKSSSSIFSYNSARNIISAEAPELKMVTRPEQKQESLVVLFSSSTTRSKSLLSATSPTTLISSAATMKCKEVCM